MGEGVVVVDPDIASRCDDNIEGNSDWELSNSFFGTMGGGGSLLCVLLNGAVRSQMLDSSTHPFVEATVAARGELILVAQELVVGRPVLIWVPL